MTVWVVEHECADNYYDAYLDCIFSTEKLANEYISSKISYEKRNYSIREVEVKEKIEEIEEN